MDKNAGTDIGSTNMVYSISYTNGNIESNNAMDKFNADFASVYEDVSEVLYLKNRTGRFKRLLQVIDGVKMAALALRLKKEDYIILRYPFNKIVIMTLFACRKFRHFKDILVIEDINFIRYGEQRMDKEIIKKGIHDICRHDIIMSPTQRYIDLICEYEEKTQAYNFSMYPYSLPENAEKYVLNASNYEGNKICFVGNLDKSAFLTKLSLSTYTLDLYGVCNSPELYAGNIRWGGGT